MIQSTTHIGISALETSNKLIHKFVRVHQNQTRKSRAKNQALCYAENMRFVILFFLLTSSIFAQSTMEDYKIFDSKGNPKTLQEVIDSFKNADVIFVGEQHDDANR